jgi:simple sugar transport system permease protein
MTTTLEPTTPEKTKIDWAARGRAALPVALRWAAAIGGALIIFSGLIILRGANPLEVFPDMWASTFMRPRPVSQIFILMGSLVLAALAVVVPARAGMSNVGGEGQVIVGAIAACGVALALDGIAPGALVLPLMAVAAMLAGAAWAGIAGVMRLTFRVNEAVSTLLLNFVALDLLLFLIYQPWRESSAGQPTTKELADGAKLPLIPGTEIHVGIILAVLATLLVFLLLSYTRWGFRLSVVGGNAEAARRAGMPVAMLLLSALLVGGALAGLAGMIEFSGIEFKLRSGFGSQVGYVGFLASWLARHKPIPVLIAAFVFAALAVAGDSLQLDAQLPAASVSILTALILAGVLGWSQRKAKKL